MDSSQHNQVDKNDVKIALLENSAVVFGSVVIIASCQP